VALVCAVDACGGGRTAPWRVPSPEVELCPVGGRQRACSNACGDGVETCRDGVWSGCTVAPVSQTCSSPCGGGKRTCRDGVWSDCDAPQPRLAVLHATLRDFHATHPDMESPGSGDRSELGLVEPILGSDDTPVFAHTTGTSTVTGPDTFAQWYHDVPGVNVAIPFRIQLLPSPEKPGFYQYGGIGFFPLDVDPRGFGDEGQQHDFDFTLATKFTFHYLGGETFRFQGDDDLWVFINRRLAIDLGGLHQLKADVVNLDDRAAEFGLERDHRYELHLFFAERHVIDSDFFIETSISDPGSCE
jgi:fibro-slime domain-containing protein